MLSRLFIVALWSPAGKGLTSWLSFVMFNYIVVTFPCGILGQMLYMIVSISDLFPSFVFSYNKVRPCYLLNSTEADLVIRVCKLFFHA